MKKNPNVNTILIVFLLLIQSIIFGCTTTVTKDMQKEELIKEELQKEDTGLTSQKLYQAKCYPCHELQDIDAYSYTPEQWVSVIDNMHDARDYSAIITPEEDEKIKGYLKNMSQKK